MSDPISSFNVKAFYRVHSILQTPESVSLKPIQKNITATDIVNSLPNQSGQKNLKVADRFISKIVQLFGDTIYLNELHYAMKQVFINQLEGYINILQKRIIFYKNHPAKYAFVTVLQLQTTKDRMVQELQSLRKALSDDNKFRGILLNLKNFVSEDIEGLSDIEEFEETIETLNETVEVADLGADMLEVVGAFAGPVLGFLIAIADLILVAVEIVDAVRDNNYMKITITNRLPGYGTGSTIGMNVDLNDLQGEMVDPSGNRITHGEEKKLDIRSELPPWPNSLNLISDTVVMYFLPPAGVLSKINGELFLSLSDGGSSLDLQDDFLLKFYKTTSEEFHDVNEANYRFSIEGTEHMELGFNGTTGAIPSKNTVVKTAQLTREKTNKFPGYYVNMKLTLSNLNISFSEKHYGFQVNTLDIVFSNVKSGNN